MALPQDQETRFRCYRNALRNWNFTGYIAFKEPAAEWLSNELSAYSPRHIGRELLLHVESGGEIDEQPERRPEYVHHEFHYDLRIQIGGRLVYFETVLLCDDPDNPDDPRIVVVSVHDA